MNATFKKTVALALLAANAFSAGYILPNGTILYDGSTDQTTYRVDRLTPQAPVSAPAPAPAQTVVVSEPIQTTRVVIEDRAVTYETPVYIRERFVGVNPMYDVVDVAGTVLVYGLLYDAVRHGFYHHELHRGYKFNRYRR